MDKPIIAHAIVQEKRESKANLGDSNIQLACKVKSRKQWMGSNSRLKYVNSLNIHLLLTKQSIERTSI